MGVLAALFLFVSGAGQATPQRSDAMTKSAAAPSPQAEPDDLAASCEETQQATSAIGKKPPTHMQRCQAACRGIKGASAHSKCIHNCMSRR
jgi:hypothetical protein